MLFKLGEYIINTEKILYVDYNSNEGNEDSKLKTSLRLYLSCGDREKVIVLYNNAANEAFTLLSDIASVELKTGFARASAVIYEPERIQAEAGYFNAYAHRARMENESHEAPRRNQEELHRQAQEIKEEIKKELNK